MTWEIRPATQDERDRFVRSTWRRSFASPRNHRTPLGREDYFSLRGDEGAKLSKDWWLLIHATAIDDELRGSECAVAVVDGECLGWVAWRRTDGTDGGVRNTVRLHYVYVATRFRRQGIGVSLLRAALATGSRSLPPTHMTYEGELLLSAMSRQQARPTDERQQRQAAHDG